MKNARDLIIEELSRDRALRLIHLNDAIKCLMAGDMRTGLIMIRNLVNATCGFPVLAKALKKDPKSVMRMLSPNGQPRSDNLFGIINYLVSQEHGWLEVKTETKKKAA